MAHALRLGARGLGRVWPWPSVGCVIVKDGRIIGRGVSNKAAGHHAEVAALSQAGDAAKDATVYVTLEPCSHQGSTPPCADALIAAGVSRIVAAVQDPNPQVAGQGFAKLRDAGIEVVTGVGEAEARVQHRGFFSVIEKGRPFVTLKLATTLDGRIATASGESRWITGPEARRCVHAMRLSHDAVLVGGGTARADDPTLTVRDMGQNAQPVRIVVSRRLNLPMPCRLSQSISEGPVWLVHGSGEEDADSAQNWAAAGANLLAAPVQAGQVDAAGLLKVLATEGLTRIFCEGGGAMAASLLDAGLVDELILMTAGLVLGAEGQPAIGALGVSALADVDRFDLVETRAIGGDVMQRWRA